MRRRIPPMGEFFDAIYTRGIDGETLSWQLTDAAHELNCCFLVAPEMRGWRAIYSSDGQNGEVAKALHKLLKTEVLFTLVHDSDIFCYDYYRDGKLVDQYNSRPEYFGKVSASKRQSLEGKPQLLLPLLRDPSDVGKLESILRSEPAGDPFHASSQLMQFGELLGLPNCASSYDYLISDEEDEAIQRRAEFVHIPELQPEKAARALAREGLRAETDRMRAGGILLFEQSPSPLPPVADPAGRGFVTADRNTALRAVQRPIYLIAPPFGEGPTPLEIDAAPGHHVVLSASGRLLAVVEQRRIEVWDRETATRVTTMESEPSVHGVRFLAEEKGLVAAGRRVQVFSLPDGKRVRTIEIAVGHAMALHPAGSLLVVVSRRATVQVVDLEAGQVVRTFFLDRRQDLGFFGKMQVALLTAAVGKARKEADRKLARVENAMAAAAAETEEPLTAEDPRTFLFTADGKYLICGTSKSAWVFRWRTLLASGVETPPALYRYQPESKASGMPMAFLMQTDYSAGVGALAHDPETNSALLGCGDGVVRRMDLASGEVNTLLSVPGGNLIQWMTLSADSSLLCTIDLSMHDMQNRMLAMMGGSPLAAAVRDDGPRDRMMIWDYKKVRGPIGSRS
jgi:hypothetical protein